MRFSIKGKDLTVTVKSDRELTIQETIAAYQLATGDFEALFVDETKKDDSEILIDDVAIPEKGTPVFSEVLCPFCGFNGKSKTRWGNSFCKCPNCHEKLFNSFATGKAGEMNSYECHYLATEPMQFKQTENEYEAMFIKEED